MNKYATNEQNIKLSLLSFNTPYKYFIEFSNNIFIRFRHCSLILIKMFKEQNNIVIKITINFKFQL